MMRALLFHTVSNAARSGQLGGVASFGMSLYQRALSLLIRLALGGMLAAVGGIAVGAAATDGGLVQLLVTGLAAMALWIPAFLLVSRLAAWRRRRRIRQASVAGSPAGGKDAPARPTVAIDAAWSKLALAAGPRHGDVRRIEGQLAQVWRALPSQSLDPQTHELQLLMGRRIPELIETRLSCLPLRRRERAEAVDELLHLLADFAQDSAGRYEQLAVDNRNRHAIVRRRIEDHLGRDGLSPLR